MDSYASEMGKEMWSCALDNEFEMIWPPGDALWATKGKTQIPQVPEQSVLEKNIPLDNYKTPQSTIPSLNNIPTSTMRQIRHYKSKHDHCVFPFFKHLLTPANISNQLRGYPDSLYIQK